MRTVEIPIEGNLAVLKSAEQVLLSGMIDCVFEMTLISEGERQILRYDTEGFEQAKDWQFKSIVELLDVLEKVLEIVEILRDYMIFPSDYELTLEDILVCSKNNYVKLVYVPKTSENSTLPGENTSLESNENTTEFAICALLDELCSQLQNGEQKALLRLKNEIAGQNLSKRGMILAIEDLKTEISLIGLD